MSGKEEFIVPNLQYFKTYMKLAEKYFQPIFMHFDQVDMRRPALLVGNHTLFGLLDIPFIV